MTRMSRFKVPHTLVLLFGMVVLAQVLSYLQSRPAEFDRVENCFRTPPGGAGQLPPHAGRSGGVAPRESDRHSQEVSVGHTRSSSSSSSSAARSLYSGATGAVDAAVGSHSQTLGGSTVLAGGRRNHSCSRSGRATIGFGEEYFPFRARAHHARSRPGVTTGSRPWGSS